ncbi:hypothetical protein A6V39_04220 [Candidatus Mycoplasma haematobovis]|uniref:UvrD-like helicase ATP-binding domain-containing protein n=1 Tax=Candidatus Mycoplasma haematobovis TaxID=432608 RepID=A0A1A9QBY7_9MOLU|nr:UvrD-helicase domain-containing protein [Candidatus Mycoplasma haematobovis]OAL10092.1 hypothetical protein A6V39_04220 [Candidatus Mycoplasma haematobovis]
MGELKLDALNKQQKQAIIAPLKPCLVLAGAGTGKTTILVKRFKHLVTQEKILADEIVITTFTNRATGK